MSIKITEIYKRNLAILLEQKAKYDRPPVSVLNQIEDTKNNIEGLEAELRRRLFGLQEKQAKLGFSADPALLNEIEDIENYFKSTEPMETTRQIDKAWAEIRKLSPKEQQEIVARITEAH